MIKIAVDCMGGDHAPHEVIKGCILAMEEYNDIHLTLVGQEEKIRSQLDKAAWDKNRITIHPAAEVISTHEPPVTAIRKKKDSSMVVGLGLVKEGYAQAFISAGSTGALMAGALLKVGRIKGINRPALAPIIPTRKQGVMLIDAGANADCKVENLVQFGIMGSVYMGKVVGREKPQIGLVNIGEEEEKGSELYKGAYQALKESSLAFAGNIEARKIPEGNVDVLVCDGFVGNTILKFMEGLAFTLFDMLKEEFTRDLKSKLTAMVLKPGLREFKKKMDYTEYGGAPLLGINGGVIKAHGSSNALAFKNAVRQARDFVKGNVVETIRHEIENLGASS
jgi:glycerol-3-phosphate acyltransferase PlsX